MSHPLIPVLLAAAVLLAGGCQKAADVATEQAVERATGQRVEVDRDGNQVRIRSNEGEMTIASGEGVALPADFPDDVFLPSTYGVSSVMDIGGARLVNLETEGEVPAVFDAARADMERKGWTQTLAMQQADSAMLGCRQGEREAAYTFTRHNGAGLTIGIQLRGTRQ